jgi:hypothetical protein
MLMSADLNLICSASLGGGLDVEISFYQKARTSVMPMIMKLIPATHSGRGIALRRPF